MVTHSPNPKIYAIDPSTGACTQNSEGALSSSCTAAFNFSGAVPHPEDFDFVEGDFYGVAFNQHSTPLGGGDGHIYRASLTDFIANTSPATPDILITQEYPVDQKLNGPMVDAGRRSGLYQVRFSAGNTFNVVELARTPGICPGATCLAQWEHVTFVPTSDVTIVKSPDGSSFNIGDNVSFTIVVTSTGPGTATSVKLTDPLPIPGNLTSWQVDSVTPSGLITPAVTNASCSITGNQLSCNFGSMAPQATVTVRVSTKTAGGANAAACAANYGRVNNTATVTADPSISKSDSGFYTCTPPVTSVEARITGGGSIFATVNGTPGVRVTHGLELRCDATDTRQSLEINWDGGNNFHLDKLINSVTCFDDPTTQPPPPPSTVVDTYAGNTLFNGKTGYHGFGYAVGTGTCNKIPATIYFILIDAGEPGTADIAEYHITGGCTLDAGPALITKGNHQFHKK